MSRALFLNIYESFCHLIITSQFKEKQNKKSNNERSPCRYVRTSVAKTDLNQLLRRLCLACICSGASWYQPTTVHRLLINLPSFCCSKVALRVFLKVTTTRYRIGRRTKVS